MNSKNHLDPHSQKFVTNWTRAKRSSSQVNGNTMMSQPNLILKTNTKAHSL
ncbi:YpzG family protein [Bacillus sp. EAC]|uniref:YpzG family protein n=1 Tax=Bacillus sp. EAC TaxID=1978338 RepID=UPI000B432C13|nr:YpzG family protein [Bacillus sp. EAC]